MEFEKGKAAADLIRGWVHYEMGSLDLSRRFFKSNHDYNIKKNPKYEANQKVKNISGHWRS